MSFVFISYQLQYVRCGKPRCHCMNGSAGHGPYWYGFYAEPRTNRTRSKYMGKNFVPPPEGEGPHAEARSSYEPQPPPPEPRRRKRRTKAAPPPPPRGRRSQHQAPPPPPHGQRRSPPPPRDYDAEDAAVLGVQVSCTKDELKKAYRRLMRDTHPDQFPESERKTQSQRAQAINVAYDRMLQRRGWSRT